MDLDLDLEPWVRWKDCFTTLSSWDRSWLKECVFSFVGFAHFVACLGMVSAL